MRDYYSLSAFFNSIDENGMYDDADKVPSPSLLLADRRATGACSTAAQQKIAAAEAALAEAIGVGRAAV